jgi:outer membrane lipoprotein-sorting protein
MKKNITGILFLFVLVVNSVYAKNLSAASDADNVLAKVADGFSGVQDFIVTIDAEVNMEQMQVPNMHAIMYFKRPDKIHFDSQGFLFVPRDGIVLNPAVLSERYDASLIGNDTLNGKILFKIQLAAKEKKTKLRQMYVWIDPANWTIAKIETIPYEGRTLIMFFTYGLVKEKYWLPAKIVFVLGSTGEREKGPDDISTQQADQFSRAQRTMPRNGSITIQYSDYKVNTGFDDPVFKEKK